MPRSEAVLSKKSASTPPMPKSGSRGLHRRHDHPDTHQIEDLVEGAPLHHHLLVDRPEVFRAAHDVGPDAELGQAGLHVAQHLREVDVALGRPPLDHLVDLGVAPGVQRRERQVFELLLHVLHAEPVGQRRVDVERLACRALLLELGQGGDGAQVVEPIGQLDDQHPDVLGDGDDHLAHRRGLLLLLGVVRHPLELGDAVDDPGQARAELALELGEADVGVLDRVVQQRARDGDVVEPLPGHDRGHRHGMADVGLARLAGLTGVGGVGEREGPLDQVGGGLGVALEVALEQLRDLGRGGPARRPPPGKNAGDRRHVNPSRSWWTRSGGPRVANARRETPTRGGIRTPRGSPPPGSRGDQPRPRFPRWRAHRRSPAPSGREARRRCGARAHRCRTPDRRPRCWSPRGACPPFAAARTRRRARAPRARPE